MDALHQEFENRKEEIHKGMELMFKANMTITDWDVPEVDGHKAATMLVAIMQNALDKIKADVEARKYDYY